MFKAEKIVCPVDLEGNYEPALALAREIAEREKSTIYLVNVARIPYDQMDVPLPIKASPHWEQTALAGLARIAQAHLGAIPCQLVVRSGIPDTDLVQIATELGADLIVMATHGRKGVSHFFLGSVTERVVREAPCPVLTVRAA